MSGDVASLCAPPDYMLGLPKSAMPPICQVVMQGSTKTKADACCPNGLSLPVNPTVIYQPQPPQCSQSIDTSPYSMALSSVSAPYARTAMPGGSMYADYTFAISPTGSCDSSAINQCCNMAVDRVQITLASSAMVVRTQLNGATLPASSLLVLASPLGAQSTTLTLSNLGLTGAVASTSSIKLTVRLPSGSNKVPDICAAGSPATATVGNCHYSLLPPVSSAQMCCPTSTTSSLAPSVIPPTPSTCSPSVPAPITSTTMGFNFYEGPVAATATSTKFSFMVYNTGMCAGKSTCADVCNWQLYINPAIAPLVSVLAEDGSLSATGLQVIDSGNNASITFFNAPFESTTVMYTVIVAKAGVTLAT